MQTITTEQIYARWEQIPEVLREAFSSTENGAIIWKACEDAGLPEEVIDTVLIVVGNILFGFTHVNDFAKELQSIPGMDQKAVDSIIFQVDRRIFVSVKGEMMKLYRAMSGSGPSMIEGEQLQVTEDMSKPRIVVEGGPAMIPQASGASGAESATLRATQFETRKIKIGEEGSPMAREEEGMIEGPAMIHREEAVVPVASKKSSLSSFGGVFGFQRKSSQQGGGQAVAAQVSMVQGLGKKPEEAGRTEQQGARVVHYTSAQGPQDLFGQTREGGGVQQQEQRPENSGGQSRQDERTAEVTPPIVVMKTPQRPEPVDGEKRKEPEPKLTEIPVADDVVDLRAL